MCMSEDFINQGEDSIPNLIIPFEESFIECYALDTYTDFDTDKDCFLNSVLKGKGSNWFLNAESKSLDQLKKIVQAMPFPLTITYEPIYVDRVYRDEYYAYYSKKHFSIPRNSERLCFFKGRYNRRDFLSPDPTTISNLQQNIIGMIVLKPTGTLGRTLISPFQINVVDCCLRTTAFEVSVLGTIFKLDAFPFSGQDHEMMTCAEVNIWEIVEYFGHRYNHYRSLLPSEMLEMITEYADERLIPSDGLTVEQESRIFKYNGLSPKIYLREIDYLDNETGCLKIRQQYNSLSEASFDEILHFYVESGIPVLLNLRPLLNSKKNGQDDAPEDAHSVTCIGHGLYQPSVCFSPVSMKDIASDEDVSSPSESINRADCIKSNLTEEETACEEKSHGLTVLKSWSAIDEYVIMEDHSVPYQLHRLSDMSFSDDPFPIHYEIESFIVPLYKHVFMVAEDAYNYMRSLINGSSEAIIDCIQQNNPNAPNEIVIRLFLTTSRAYKEYRISSCEDIQEKSFFSQALFPKFIWACEFSTRDLFAKHMALGEYVLDATSSWDQAPVILMRHGRSICYRGPEDPEEYAEYRRDVIVGASFKLFEQNNLKHSSQVEDKPLYYFSSIQNEGRPQL